MITASSATVLRMTTTAALLMALLHSLPAADPTTPAPATPTPAAPAPAPTAKGPFELRKEGNALRKEIDVVRDVLTQALGNSPLDDKQKAVDRYTALRATVQTFSDRAIAAGKTDEEVGDLLDRFQFSALSKMDRDLRAAINEGAKPKP